MARLIDQNVTTYWWVAASDITDTAAISAAKLTAAKNISEFVVSTTNVGPTASDTVSEKSITDTANVVVPTVGNYEGTLVLFRDFTTGVPTANDVLTTITKVAGTTGWIVKRLGYPSTTAAAAAQVVSAYKFTTDVPQVTGGQSDGYLKATIPLLQAGSFKVEVAILA